MNAIPFGLCHCGCGGTTTIVKKTNTSRGWIAGQPTRYISGHNSVGKTNSHWKGGKQRFAQGYIGVWQPEHPAATKGYIAEHTLVIEKALGKYLPLTAVTHHVDENKANNAPGNLVACENQAYHMVLHTRLRALRACGNPHWRRCCFCKQYDDPAQMRSAKNGAHFVHRICRSTYNKERWARRGTA